jgi:hypothetical protein
MSADPSVSTEERSRLSPAFQLAVRLRGWPYVQPVCQPRRSVPGPQDRLPLQSGSLRLVLHNVESLFSIGCPSWPISFFVAQVYFCVVFLPPRADLGC